MTFLRKTGIELGLYTLVNVVLRGVLAVLAIVASTELGLAAFETAVLLAFGVVWMRFGRILIAPLNNLGTARSAAIGFALVSVGLLSINLAQAATWLLWPGVALLGIGYGAVVLAIKVSMVARASSADTRLAALSWLAVAVNVGAALGPTIAGLLVGAQAFFLALLASSALAIAAAILTTSLVEPSGAASQVRFRWAHLAAIRSPRLWIPLIELFVAFVLYAQIAAVLPLRVSAEAGPAYIGGVFALNAVVVALLQVPVTKFLGTHGWRSRFAGSLGLGVFACGFAVLAFVPGILGVLIATVLLSAAECVVLPQAENSLTEQLGQRELALAFTISAVVAGLGEGIGTLLGVFYALDTQASQQAINTVWMVVAVLAAAVLMYTRGRRQPGTATLENERLDIE